MKNRKRILSGLLAFMMTFNVVAGNTSMLAFAEESAVEQETSAPETSAPETIAPETSAPETSAPETSAPETSAPETSVPETSTPETSAPETNTSETEKRTSVEESEQETSYVGATETEDGENDPPLPESEEETESEEDGAKENETEYNKSDITGEDNNNGVRVTVNAPAGSFPEGTQVKITAFDSEESTAYANGILENDAAAAFDISFEYENRKVQPENGKEVALVFRIDGASELAAEEGELRLYHIGTSSPDLLKTEYVSNPGNTMEILVNTSEFSPFVLTRPAENDQDMIQVLNDGPQQSITPLHPYVTSISLTANGNPIGDGSEVTHGDNISAELFYVIPNDVFAAGKIFSY